MGYTPIPGPIEGPWVITYSNEGINLDNSSFYYNDQVVHWLANYGLPLVNVSLSNIDANVWYNTATAINFGAQAGGCGVMFFVVLVLSHAAKRKTPIFILNVLSLMFGFFRNLLTALYFVSPWVQLYPYYTTDYSATPTRAYALSVAATVFQLLLNTSINLSLTFQAYTVTKNMKNLYRYSIIFLSGLIFFLALGFQFAEMVMNCIAIVQATIFSAAWVQQGALYMETAAIWYFSIIFTSKLVYTLYYRRKHGWKQWSGVKILAAMGGCTMLVPCKNSLTPLVDSILTPNQPFSPFSNMSRSPSPVHSRRLEVSQSQWSLSCFPSHLSGLAWQSTRRLRVSTSTISPAPTCKFPTPRLATVAMASLEQLLQSIPNTPPMTRRQTMDTSAQPASITRSSLVTLALSNRAVIAPSRILRRWEFAWTSHTGLRAPISEIGKWGVGVFRLAMERLLGSCLGSDN